MIEGEKELLDGSGPRPSLSIVIPARNEEHYIGSCLDSIRNCISYAIKREVIIVDNGSTDKTVHIAETFKKWLDLRIVVDRMAKIGGLRNIGARLSTGDVIAFLDADCAVDKEWEINAVRCLRQDTIGVAGASHEVGPQSSWVGRTWYLHVRRNLNPGFVESLPSGNMVVKRKVFFEVGGFNESLVTNEDFELCFRIRDRGYTVYSDPSIRAFHLRVSSSLREFYSKSRWHGADVLKVFLIEPAKLRNARALSFAGYFCFCTICLILGCILGAILGEYALLVASAVAICAPCGVLAIKTGLRQGKYGMWTVRLFLLYLVYGISRAHSLMDSLFRMAARRH